MSNNFIELDLEVAENIEPGLIACLPTTDKIQVWLNIAFDTIKLNFTNNVHQAENALVAKLCNTEEAPISLCIKVVSAIESQSLNLGFREIDKPTNVLSFESDLPDFIPSNFIGDLAICAKIVSDEAILQNKQISDHWAHMCIHGLLHLLGYDHIKESEANEMETLEVNILANLGIDDPYQIS